MASLKAFWSHKPVLLLVLLSTLFMGILEYAVTSNSTGNLDAESLNSASLVFFFANLASLGVTCWAIIWLMKREAKNIYSLSVGDIVFSLMKSLLTMVVWALLSFTIAASVISFLYPDLNLLDKNTQALSLMDQILIFSIVAFFVGHSYAVLMTVLSGSMLRYQTKFLKGKDKPFMARWYLPLIAGYTSLTQPLIWLALASSAACKAAAFWLGSQGLAPAGWAFDGLSVLSVFYGFFVAYRHYARPSLESKFQPVEGV